LVRTAQDRRIGPGGIFNHGGARVDDQLVTLLPGESVTFAVTSAAVIEDAAWADPTVLRSANQLVVGA
jgi:beta-mannosidase